MSNFTKLTITSQDALIVIDIQNDFLPNGALAVAGGDQIIDTINRLMPLFDHVAFSQDCHPDDHISFADNHPEQMPYSTIMLDYGRQTLWPRHCVTGTKGADFSDKLNLDFAHAIIRKGYRTHIDSYSAFMEQDKKTLTGLAGWLHEQSVKRVFLCGLATDFCVCYSAIDATTLGFESIVIKDASRGIDLNGSLQKAYEDMKDAGVQIIDTAQLLAS